MPIFLPRDFSKIAPLLKTFAAACGTLVEVWYVGDNISVIVSTRQVMIS